MSLSEPHRHTVGGRLLLTAAHAPDRPALVDGVPGRECRRRWTFGELAEEATQLARALAARFGRGERLAVCSAGIPEWNVLQYAAGLAGLVLVPVNPASRPPEIEHVLRRSAARGIVVGPEFRGVDLGGLVRRATGQLAEAPVVFDFEDLVALDVPAGGPAAMMEVRPEDSALIIFTSGTTGEPKGVLLSHEGILRNAEAVVTRGEVAAGSVWLNPLPMFHAGGCIFVALGALVSQGSIVQMAQFDAGLALELIEEERPVVTSCVPTMAHMLMNHPSFASRAVSSLQKSFTGGASIPPDLVRTVEDRFAALTFVTTYGQTEAGPTISVTRPGDSLGLRATTIGLPLDGYEVRIVDPATQESVEIGAQGELWVRSRSTMVGYIGEPERTAEVKEADGWLRTRDLCSLTSDGYLRHHGRIGDLIIRGGENIAPYEVEDVLSEHPAVAEAAVVGVPDLKYGERVAAFVRLVASADVDGAPDSAVLVAWCRDRIAAFKCPSEVWIVDDFPLTASGKVRRVELRSWHQSRANESANLSKPRNEEQG